MKDEELKIIEDRLIRLRPGPWVSFAEGRDHTSGSSFIKVSNGDWDDIELIGATIAEQDFIANAREDIPTLIMEIKRLKELVKSKC